MADLVVHVTGPSAADVKVFVDWGDRQYRIGLLQKFSLEVSTETFLPRVTMTLPALNLHDEELPEIDDNTIRIVLQDAVVELEGLEAKVRSGCAVLLGHEPVGLLRRVFLEAIAGAPNHSLVFELAKGINGEDMPAMPDWVSIVGSTQKQGNQVEKPPIINYGEGFKGQWENTEYDEDPKKDEDE